MYKLKNQKEAESEITKCDCKPLCVPAQRVLIKSHTNTFLLSTKLYLDHNFTHLEASEGFLIKAKMKAETKLTFIMCCQIFY